MKTLLAVLVVVCALVAIQPEAVASPVAPEECALLGANENGDAIFGGVGLGNIVENPIKVVSRCKGDGITNDSGQSHTYMGFVCAILRPTGEVVFTQDSTATISASGHATMICTYHFSRPVASLRSPHGPDA